MNFIGKGLHTNKMEVLSDIYSGKAIKRFIKNIDPYLLVVILLSIYIPLIGVHLYFRYDDAGTLLWAVDFKKNFFYAFDPRPWFDEYNFYNGVGGYYRPFESLYIMLLIKIFGPEPVYFQLINGILVIATIVFIYKITTMLSGNRLAGLLSVVVFHLAFQSLLYGIYHVVVPFGFFFEIVTFYLFMKGLYESNLKTIGLGFLVLIPATNRQTTMLILTAMVIIFFITNWRELKFKHKTRMLILILVMLPNVLLLFTKNSSHATILNQPFSPIGYLNYIRERLYFYSNLLIRPLPGILILPILSIYWINKIPYQKMLPKLNNKLISAVVVPFSLVLTVWLLKIQMLAIIYIFATLIFLFFTNKKLQLILSWFFVSLGLFSIINFYHDAYFLEAAFALAIVSGILVNAYLKSLQDSFSVVINPKFKSICLVTGAFLVLIFGIIVWKVPSLPIIGHKIEAVKILIETNENFKAMINYLAKELPQNAKVFQLSEEYLGLTMNERRFLSLRQRAENVKVIDIRNSNVMIKVLGRWDIEFKHAEGLTLGIPDNCVFIVHNKLEKSIAEKKFDLQPIKRFCNQNTEAGVYKVLGLKEDLYPNS